jgi:hypothetical protein
MRHHTYRHFLWTIAAAGAFIVGCQRSGSGDYRATADVPPPDRSSTASDSGVRMSAERTSGDTRSVTPATPATPQDSTTAGVVTERTAPAPTTAPAPATPEAAPAAAPAPAAVPAPATPVPDAAAEPARPGTPAPSPTPPDRDQSVPPGTGADRAGDPARNATPPAPIDLGPAPATRPSTPTTRPANEVNK